MDVSFDRFSRRHCKFTVSHAEQGPLPAKSVRSTRSRPDCSNWRKIMADACESLRARLRTLEAELKDSQPVPGERHPPKPPPQLNGLIREIETARDELNACVESTMIRRWTVTGETFLGAFAIDRAIKRFMMAQDIRALSVAIARDGPLIGKRGYTWALPDYPITQPDTLFRVASVSKLFTCAAIDQLATTGALNFATPAFPFLGITPLPFTHPTGISTTSRSSISRRAKAGSLKMLRSRSGASPCCSRRHRGQHVWRGSFGGSSTQYAMWLLVVSIDDFLLLFSPNVRSWAVSRLWAAAPSDSQLASCNSVTCAADSTTGRASRACMSCMTILCIALTTRSMNERGMRRAGPRSS